MKRIPPPSLLLVCSALLLHSTLLAQSGEPQVGDKGLAPGDLLPGYRSVYDIVLSRWDIWPRRSLVLGEQKVFRGDKVFTVQGAR